MALPYGCHKVCRPRRKEPRRFTVKDLERIVCRLREQGVSSEEINAAVQVCADGPGECDCERIAIVIGAAIAVIALAIAIRTRNRAALKAAKDAIARARRPTTQTGRIELDEARREIDGVIAREDSIAASMEKTLQILRMLEQDAFTGMLGNVRIIP